jgi:hypothetical protein
MGSKKNHVAVVKVLSPKVAIELVGCLAEMLPNQPEDHDFVFLG